MRAFAVFASNLKLGCSEGLARKPLYTASEREEVEGQFRTNKYLKISEEVPRMADNFSCGDIFCDMRSSEIM